MLLPPEINVVCSLVSTVTLSFSLCSMVSARNRKSLRAEDILAETCADTLSGGLSDMLSKSDDSCSSSFSYTDQAL
jgi:hypothetical protein